MKYEIIRSKRKTLSLEVKPDGRVIARAPLRLKEAEIERFVNEKQGWINKQLLRFQEANSLQNSTQKLTEEQLKELYERAKLYLPKRVEYYARLVNTDYGRITVRCQKTKWGSCSAKGNLNFNCLLMLAPEEVIDCVVVHELCHRREMNHGSRFYSEVLRVYPDYYKHYAWLKKNGAALMAKRP